MKAFILCATVTIALSTVAAAQTPSWTVPQESARCPSKWGAADERGSANHQKPAAVMNAAKLIKTGEVIELAHVLGPSMAFFGTRRFFRPHLRRCPRKRTTGAKQCTDSPPLARDFRFGELLQHRHSRGTPLALYRPGDRDDLGG